MCIVAHRPIPTKAICILKRKKEEESYMYASVSGKIIDLI